MKQSTFVAVLVFWLAMITSLVLVSTEPAFSWGRGGTMLEGVSQSEMAPYRFGGSPYQPGGYCGPTFQGPLPFGGTFGAGAPPVPMPRPYPPTRMPALGGCE
jgi:hypothetical protein